MRHAQATTRQVQPAQCGKMGHKTLAVALFAIHGLRLALGQMGLQRQAELGRQGGATLQESVRAMQRDGWRQAKPDLGRVEWPVMRGATHHVQAGVRVCGAQSGQCGLQSHGQIAEQFRVDLIKRAVSHHRRDHRPDARGGVSAGHRVQAVQRRGRKLRAHVEQGSAAFLEQFNGGEGGAQGQVVQPAVPVDRRRRGQKTLQRDIGHRPPTQCAVGMGVAIDQAGDHQPVACIDRACCLKAGELARHPDFADAAVNDQQVGKPGGLVCIGQHQTVDEAQ